MPLTPAEEAAAALGRWRRGAPKIRFALDGFRRAIDECELAFQGLARALAANDPEHQRALDKESRILIPRRSIIHRDGHA